MFSVQLLLAACLATISVNTAFVQQLNGLAFVHHPKVTSTVLFEIDVNSVTEAVKYPGEAPASSPPPSAPVVEFVAPPPPAAAPVEVAPAPVIASPASRPTTSESLPVPPPPPETSLFESIPFPVLGGPVLVAGLYVSYQIRISKQARQAEEDAAEAAATFVASTSPPPPLAEVVVVTPPEIEATTAPEAVETPSDADDVEAEIEASSEDSTARNEGASSESE